MADNQTATGPSPAVHSREGFVKGHAEAFLRVLDATRTRAAEAYLGEVLKARDQEWVSVSEKTAGVFKKMGLLEAAKLICPACARGMALLRSKPDEKAAAAWTHHPEKDGQPD